MGNRESSKLQAEHGQSGAARQAKIEAHAAAIAENDAQLAAAHAQLEAQQATASGASAELQGQLAAATAAAQEAQAALSARQEEVQHAVGTMSSDMSALEHLSYTLDAPIGTNPSDWTRLNDTQVAHLQTQVTHGVPAYMHVTNQVCDSAYNAVGFGDQCAYTDASGTVTGAECGVCLPPQ